MRRTHPLAIRLARALREAGHNVTSRRLERWHAAGLGFPEDAPFEEQLAYYSAVASISRSGRDADLTARRLAARGYACPKLRPAILAELGISPVAPDQPQVELDLSSGPSGDPAFAELEAIASWVAASTGGLPPLMVQVVDTLRRNALRHAERIGESAEQIFHSFVVNVLFHLVGGEFYNPKAIAAVLNVDPGGIGSADLDLVNTHFRVSVQDVDEAYRSAPIEDIVRMAQLIAGNAHAVLDYLGVTGGTEAEIEDLAATFAPAALYFAGLLRQVFDDFPADVPVLPPRPRRPALEAAS